MDASAGEIVLPKLLSDLGTQLDGLTVPRHCASVYSCAKLPIKDAVVVYTFISEVRNAPCIVNSQKDRISKNGH